MKWKSLLLLKLCIFFLVLLAVSVWLLWEGKKPGGEFPWPLFLVVGAAFLAISMIGLGRILIHPVNEMIGAVENFAAGLFNWRVRLGTRRDELGRLANQLNRMAEATEEKISGLAKNLAESQALLAGLEEGVLILDLKGRVQKINESMETDVFSLSPADVGRHYLEVFRDPELNDLIQVTLAGKQGQRRSLSLLSQPGRTFHVQSSLIQDPQSGIGGVVVVFHDVTDLKRLERVRQDFVANVSHELRTPLTAIRGYVEALLDEGPENASQAKEFLRIIERHSQRMEKIVSDLLVLSEMESPDRMLNRAPLHLPALISSAIETLRPLNESKRQTVQLRVSSQLPSIMGDGQKIHQVIINLLQNAITYTPEGGQIAVEVRGVPNGVEVLVSDNGIGIPPPDLPRIFERFYRVDRGRSRELGGTGLGLSIVKHIVEAHGGWVTVESKPGQGSRFTFFLPQA
jgi:two-component system phosphate regulon sensor histidine kinase PhoR